MEYFLIYYYFFNIGVKLNFICIYIYETKVELLHD